MEHPVWFMWAPTYDVPCSHILHNPFFLLFGTMEFLGGSLFYGVMFDIWVSHARYTSSMPLLNTFPFTPRHKWHLQTSEAPWHLHVAPCLPHLKEGQCQHEPKLASSRCLLPPPVSSSSLSSLLLPLPFLPSPSHLCSSLPLNSSPSLSFTVIFGPLPSFLLIPFLYYLISHLFPFP